ncbi:Chondroitin proteoglycan 8 [Caenorhabditis elegans]|uniref:Isoform b of Chondroitin proteoglycan 8 n=1 Tax=Caenorhabditis elegans TaxID=6239 RepID=Q21175-2|nr:Chondroitin proteoglycan 8 [Caenorhabditis elegans]CCD71031.1 Chondroitin proteoglycan 8 [Caenorhabditis elegans]|eukprot:NP_872155.1 Chondroitin proteoglycan 8 [Caenorhabditis elegans]
MRPFILLALLVSVTVAFNIFRDEVVPEEQLLAVRRTTRDASDSSSDSDEKDDAKTTVTVSFGLSGSQAWPIFQFFSFALKTKKKSKFFRRSGYELRPRP